MNLSRAFSRRFYRADPSRTRHSGGSGLGLALVRSIARLHGGDASVSSKPSKSSVFTITLAARQREEPTQEPAA